MLIGIDYGSNLAGTTVVAYLDNSQKIHFFSSEQKKPADDFLKTKLKELAATSIFLDAPLSLPNAYFGKGTDYFFRACDKELKCMSPMFLGGLTARAMRLKSELAHIKFIETYPAWHARRLNLKALEYKKKLANIPAVLQVIQQETAAIALPENLPNWHHVDALLALLSAIRFQENKHETFGDVSEGQIIV